MVQAVPSSQPEFVETEQDAPIAFDWASPQQKEAVESMPGTPLLMMGGFNSGKTSAAILHMLALCDNFPGYKVAVLRKTFKDLSLTTRPSFDQWIDPKRVKSSSATEVTLDNGSSFIFHHLDSPNAATILKGLEINGAILDQAEQMQERTFTVLMGRLGRWKGARVPKWVLNSRQGDWPWKNRMGAPVPPISLILTANPTEDGDPELHWLWQRFSPESKSWQDKWSKMDYRQIMMPTTGNKFAGEQNVEILLQQDEDYVKRFVRGEWVRSKGHIFRLSDMSLLEYESGLISHIENSCMLGRVLDHGDSAPTCCLWYGVDQNHNLFFWQEYYQAGIGDDGKEYNVSDHRRSITALSRPLTFRSNLADASIFDKTRNISGFTRRQQRWSVADEYIDRKIIQEDTAIYWMPADKNEALSRQRLSQYLRLDGKHKHPITGEIGAPHIYFVQQGDDHPHGIRHAISEIRNAKRLQVGENDGKPIYSDERDPSIPDHALDCVAPNTKILTADLRYVEAGSIRVGDSLLGFDEESGGSLTPRHWRESVVEAVDRTVKPCYRLTMEDGTVVVCSYDHQWLTEPPECVSSKRKWMRTEDLDGQSHWTQGRKRGLLSGERMVLKPLSVWDTDESRDGGYLAGVLDGEGCLSYNSRGEGCFRLSITQKDNELLERVKLALGARGFRFSIGTSRQGVYALEIRGGFPENARLLGSVRPHRLLPKLRADLGRFRSDTKLKIAAREFIGNQEVVSIQTSTRTFIAEGLASHNCVRYVVNSHPVTASAPIEERKLTALAKPDGRVLITLPPIDKGNDKPRRQVEPRKWRSRGGGYVFLLAAFSHLLGLLA